MMTEVTMFVFIFCLTPLGRREGAKPIFSPCKLVELYNPWSNQRAVQQCLDYAQHVSRTPKPPLGEISTLKNVSHPRDGTAPPQGMKGLHTLKYVMLYIK